MVIEEQKIMYTLVYYLKQTNFNQILYICEAATVSSNEWLWIAD